MEPQKELPTALMSRAALRDLLAATSDDDLERAPPLPWLATGIGCVLFVLFYVLVSRF